MAQPIALFDDLDHLLDHGGPKASSYTKEDYDKALQFLKCYRGSQPTFNAYRREVERLCQWSSLIKKKAVTAMTRDDIEQYIRFCQSPPQEWVGQKHLPRFVLNDGERQPNPDWRPFVKRPPKSQREDPLNITNKQQQLSPSAISDAFAILSSFYNFMIQEQWIGSNPVAQIRQKSQFTNQQQGPSVVRRLSELQWTYLSEAAERLAIDDPDTHERSLFIIRCLYSMYLRVSELCVSTRWSPIMAHFFQDHDGLWWFRTLGKGNKQRDIAVSDAMLASLKRYRLFLGLSDLPSADDYTPLIPKQRGSGGITNTSSIRKIVQLCYDAAIEQLFTDGFEDEARQMRAATVHWLRHTGISDDVKHRPREHVRDDAGHGSGAITDRYIDIEKRARHASAKKK